MNYRDKYEEWLNSDIIDEETKSELRAIDDEAEIEDRFYTDLKFGTAGLRGKLGAGTNRMNVYTVGLATQGLAQTIVKYGQEAMDRGVAIAYDVRHKSDVFSVITSSILAANGVKVHLYPSIRPTPMLSYAVRKLGTISGIVITASHNPKMYNGYKVYWEEGSQILDSIADQILDEISNISYGDIKQMDFEAGLESGMINYIPESVDEAYYREVLNKAIVEDVDKNINIVYSPLNGTGNIPVRHVLKERGFTNVNVLKAQELPDGDFTTVGYPNPESVEAFDLSVEYAKEIDADLIIATDPDCDRVAMMAKDSNGEYYAFNGNQTGALLISYILTQLDAKNAIPENGAIVKSIVTGELGKAVCDKYGVKMFDTLTGFKNICALPNEWDKTGEYSFIFGYEESIGYTYGDYVRDKDAVVSSMMIAEMAAYHKANGKNLVEALYDMYQEYGYYSEHLVSMVIEGQEGQVRMGRMMDSIRANPLTEIGEMKLSVTTDFLLDDTGLDKSNVLKYVLDDGSWYCVRPSGTEPKIKLYIYSKSDSEESAVAKIKVIKESVWERLNSVE